MALMFTILAYVFAIICVAYSLVQFREVIRLRRETRQIWKEIEETHNEKHY